MPSQDHLQTIALLSTRRRLAARRLRRPILFRGTLGARPLRRPAAAVRGFGGRRPAQCLAEDDVVSGPQGAVYAALLDRIKRDDVLRRPRPLIPVMEGRGSSTEMWSFSHHQFRVVPLIVDSVEGCDRHR